METTGYICVDDIKKEIEENGCDGWDTQLLETIRKAYKDLYIQEDLIDVKKLNILTAIVYAAGKNSDMVLSFLKDKNIRPKKIRQHSFSGAFSGKQIKASKYILGLLEKEEMKEEKLFLFQDTKYVMEDIISKISCAAQKNEKDTVFQNIREMGEMMCLMDENLNSFPVTSLYLEDTVKRIAFLYRYHRDYITGYEGKTERIYATVIATLYNVIVDKGYSTDELSGRKERIVSAKEAQIKAFMGDASHRAVNTNYTCAVENTNEITKIIEEKQWDTSYVTNSYAHAMLMLMTGSEEPAYFYRKISSMLSQEDNELIKSTAKNAYLLDRVTAEKANGRNRESSRLIEDYLFCVMGLTMRSMMDKYEEEIEKLEYELEKQKKKTNLLSTENKKLQQQIRKTGSMNTQETAKRLSSEREKIREEVSKVYQNDIKELSDRVNELMRQLNDAKEEISLYEEDRKELGSLREFIFSLSQEEERVGQDDEISADDIRELLNGRNVMVIGGHDNWINVMKKEFPEWSYFGTKVSGLKNEHFANKEVIIIFTDYLAHPAYFAVMSKRRPDAKIIYCNQTNLKRAKGIIFSKL